MLEVLNLALNNEYIYIGIIVVLIIIIIITVLSIKKDCSKPKKVVKEIEPEVKPTESPVEQQKARMELEKVVNTMKNDLDNKKEPKDEIKTYEQEQEQKAIISYQELVEAVKKNSQNEEATAQTTPGMEVADNNVIEPVEDEQIKAVADQLTSIFDKNIEPTDVPVYQETTVEEHPEEEIPHTTVEQTTIYREEPVNIDNLDLESNSNVDIAIPVEELNVVDITKEESKKFQSSEFISPVYGRQNVSTQVVKKDDISNETPEMKHASIDDIIDDEMDSNEEFLENLKKFRNNL